MAAAAATVTAATVTAATVTAATVTAATVTAATVTAAYKQLPGATSESRVKVVTKPDQLPLRIPHTHTPHTPIKSVVE